MFPYEILGAIAHSTYENRNLTLIFCIRELLNYRTLDKFVEIIDGEYRLPDGRKHTPKTGEPITHRIVRRWYRYGKIYRDGDLPAAIFNTGTQHWCQNGKCHRDGGLPAIIHDNGTLYWYRKGKYHRDGDLPAIIHPHGGSCWYRKGLSHRDNDMPAVISKDSLEWWRNGIRHRDGNLPAVIRTNGVQQWWRNGKECGGIAN
jgi:hypothetical protein